MTTLSTPLAANASDFSAVLPDAHASVMRFLKRRIRDTDAVEDIAQETMCRCVARDRNGEGDDSSTERRPLANLKAFAIRVANNLWIDRLRRNGKDSTQTITSEFESLAEPAEASTYRPSRVARRGEREEVVQAAMERLSDTTRRIVRMRHEEDLSLREVADALNESYDAVRKRYTRGLVELRSALSHAADVF